MNALLDERSQRAVLAQHADLRVLLASLDGAAQRVIDLQPGAMSELRAQLRELAVAFRAHLNMEESLLAPILTGAAGERLQEEHAGQRAALQAISHEIDVDVDEPTRLAEDARWLVRGLLRDMCDEDRVIAGERDAAEENEGDR